MESRRPYYEIAEALLWNRVGLTMESRRHTYATPVGIPMPPMLTLGALGVQRRRRELCWMPASRPPNTRQSELRATGGY